MRASRKPALFIGSSREGLDVAYGIQELLEFDSEPTVWTQDVFRPSETTMAGLLDVARRADFALLVFTPDDVMTVRGDVSSSPRDNVVFELGLFAGVLGSDRAFYVLPRSASNMRLPTDLLGIEPLWYEDDRDDGNLIAALGPACNKLRRRMVAVALRGAGDLKAAAAPEEARRPTLNEFMQRWEAPALSASRARLRAGVVMHGGEDETGDDVRAMQQVFSFFEAFSDAVLSGELDESAARLSFSAPLKNFWKVAFVFLAPLNMTDDWWKPRPKIALLAERWS